MMTQRRALAGGEYGPNGEFYEGGKFIATRPDTVKQAPIRFERTPEDAARQAVEAARAARIANWLEGRRAALSGIVERLTVNPGIAPQEWTARLELGHAGFLPSLGRQLFVCGTLSSKQADYAVKALVGRQTKRNADEWEAIHALLTEQYSDE